MFEQIQNMIKGYAQEAVSANTEIPNEKNEAAAEAASTSIVDVLKQKVAGGDITSLLNSFKDEGAIKETSAEMSGSFAQKLSGLGINMDTAKTVAMSLIPVIMAKFSQSSGGAGGFNVQDLLSKFGGKDGGLDLSSLGGMLGGSDKKDGKDAGNDGGIMGTLKNLF